jgi:hypothetical protein
MQKNGKYILFCLVELANGRESGTEYLPLGPELGGSGRGPSEDTVHSGVLIGEASTGRGTPVDESSDDRVLWCDVTSLCCGRRRRSVPE